MKDKNNKQRKPWIAIIWFAVWGLFQLYAVVSVIKGTWERPEAFPKEAYYALLYPDMVFIPLYLSASVLMYHSHRLGNILGLIAGGAMIYVMIYLLALSGLHGAINLIFDSMFLVADSMATLQLVRLELSKEPEKHW